MLTHGYYGFHHIHDWQWSVPANGHADYTLWSVWGGKGTLKIGNTDYSLQKGDVFLLDYRQPVYGAEDDSDALEIRFVDFGVSSPSFLQGQPVRRHFAHTSFLLELFKRIAMAQSNNDRQATLAWLETLLYEYCNQPNLTSTSPYTESIEKICSQFEQAPEKHYDMSLLATELGVSTDHFIRIFAKEKALTPYAYLSKARLEFAKALLQNSSLSISQIADKLGFPDLYNFSRFFKKGTGKSPTEYKKLVYAKESEY